MADGKFDDTRILIYSHDTFGLGHLRRCRTIAHTLVEHYKGLRVLIVSGSPIIGSFDFKARVDFVRIPGVVKLRGGDYTALSSHTDLTQTLQIRSSIIEQTAKTFSPDLLIVDKEPLGLRGEVRSTIELLRAQGGDGWARLGQACGRSIGSQGDACGASQSDSNVKNFSH